MHTYTDDDETGPSPYAYYEQTHTPWEIFYTSTGLNVCGKCSARYTVVDGNEGYPGFVCEAPEHK